MRKIERKDIINLLIKNYNVSEFDYDIVLKLVDELYDFNKKSVMPLTEVETLVFRKKYGITSDGFPVSKELIAKNYGVSYKKIEKVLRFIPTKLGFRIGVIEKVNKMKKIDKMSSIDLNDKITKQNIFLNTLKVSDFTRSKLMRNLIFTLNDLMTYSKKDLSNLLSESKLDELVNYIHSIGIKFIDELDLNEKKNIIANSSDEKIINSSIFWIDGLNDLNNRFFNSRSINNIKTLFEKIDELPSNNKVVVSNSIINLGLNDLFLENHEDKSKKSK